MFRTVHVIGCGGIGSWLLPPLAKLLDVIELDNRPELELWDGDRVEEHNCLRQNFYPSDAGALKAEILGRSVGDMYPELRVVWHTRYCGVDDMSRFTRSLVLAGPDNHKCRENLLRHVGADDNVLIIGGNDSYDGTVIASRTVADADAILKRQPEIANADDGDRAEMSCAELAALEGGEQTMAANFMAAAIMFQFAAKLLNDNAAPLPLLTYFDTRTGAQRIVGG